MNNIIDTVKPKGYATVKYRYAKIGRWSMCQNSWKQSQCVYHAITIEDPKELSRLAIMELPLTFTKVLDAFDFQKRLRRYEFDVLYYADMVFNLLRLHFNFLYDKRLKYVLYKWLCRAFLQDFDRKRSITLPLRSKMELYGRIWCKTDKGLYYMPEEYRNNSRTFELCF